MTNIDNTITLRDIVGDIRAELHDDLIKQQKSKLKRRMLEIEAAKLVVARLEEEYERLLDTPINTMMLEGPDEIDI